MTDQPKADDAQGTGKALFYAAWAIAGTVVLVGGFAFVCLAVLVWAWRTITG